MNFKPLLTIAASLCMFAAVAETSTPKGWTDDFEAAKRQATAEGKLLLVAFSGSDWCGWCMKLAGEVFSQKKFISGVKDDFVLVFIDSPRNKNLLSKTAAENNPKLCSAYHVSGYPTAVVMDATGKEIGRKSGYMAGGPEAYIKHLRTMTRGHMPMKATTSLDYPLVQSTEMKFFAAVGKKLAYGKNAESGLRELKTEAQKHPDSPKGQEAAGILAELDKAREAAAERIKSEISGAPSRAVADILAYNKTFPSHRNDFAEDLASLKANPDLAKVAAFSKKVLALKAKADKAATPALKKSNAKAAAALKSQAELFLSSADKGIVSEAQSLVKVLELIESASGAE